MHICACQPVLVSVSCAATEAGQQPLVGIGVAYAFDTDDPGRLTGPLDIVTVD